VKCSDVLTRTFSYTHQQWPPDFGESKIDGSSRSRYSIYVIDILEILGFQSQLRALNGYPMFFVKSQIASIPEVLGRFLQYDI
jgi:hypothetical protein